uniref:Uncharacterized protein n=1 Tax=Octopus bimaculoides TaxID=37653 RepID=A0A0L8FMZ4_OCTBM
MWVCYSESPPRHSVMKITQQTTGYTAGVCVCVCACLIYSCFDSVPLYFRMISLWLCATPHMTTFSCIEIICTFSR